MNEIYDAFHEFFELVDADTDTLKNEVYRLRYRVFCEEENFLDAKNYPDKLEIDDYDDHSIHILLRHRATNKFVGTVRLIRQDPSSVKKPFPIEKFSQIDSNLVDISKLPRQEVVEISRFAILKEYTRRRGKREGQVTAEAETDRRRFPNIGLALVVGIVRACAKYNFSHWLSIMDPTLNRLLSYYGSNLDPVGPLVDYHGMRRPYHIHLSEVLDRMYKKHRNVWELMTDYGKVWPKILERRKKSRLPTNETETLLGI